MRYQEIVEASQAARIADQRARVADAYGALRSKEATVSDARASAQKLPFGAERNKRLQAASRREADARRSYNDTRTAANRKISDIMSKR